MLKTNNDLEKVKQELQVQLYSKNNELQDLRNTNVLSNMEIEKLKQGLKDSKAEIKSKNSELKAVREDANASKNEYEMKALGKDMTIKALRI